MVYLKNKRIILPALLFFTLLFSLASSQPYNVKVTFWKDELATEPYCNVFTTAYLLNKTVTQSGSSYHYLCYVSNYTCEANIQVNDTRYYDLYFTNGVLMIDNETGCPIRVENADFHSLIQSGIYVDRDYDLKYLINITVTSDAPKTIFNNTLSLKQFFTMIYYLSLIIIIIVLEVLLIRNTGQFSPSLAILVFLVGILFYLILF